MTVNLTQEQDTACFSPATTQGLREVGDSSLGQAPWEGGNEQPLLGRAHNLGKQNDVQEHGKSTA